MLGRHLVTCLVDFYGLRNPRGLAAFKQSFEQQEKDSQDFIPTVRMMMRV